MRRSIKRTAALPRYLCQASRSLGDRLLSPVQIRDVLRPRLDKLGQLLRELKAMSLISEMQAVFGKRKEDRNNPVNVAASGTEAWRVEADSVGAAQAFKKGTSINLLKDAK